MQNRRQFIKKATLSGLAITALPISNFAKTFFSHPSDITWGCASITWGDDFLKGIDEIASLGYKGVQLRGNAMKAFENNPDALLEKLKKAGIKMPVFSGGGASANPETEATEMELFLKQAKFVKAMKGKYLQITSVTRPTDGTNKDMLLAYANRINKIGVEVSKLGVELVFHNHMHQYGENPEEIQTILDATDPKHVGLLLDVAHYFQGGGDPAKVINQYKNRLKILHIKDVKSPLPDFNGKPERNYKFVELGQGKIDLKAIMKALNEIHFKGWCMVELDSVPDTGKTPFSCAKTSADYIKNNLGFKL